MTFALVRDDHPGYEKLDSPDYGTKAWHSTRLLKLGGSEVAAILGLSTYASYYSTFCRKMGIDLGDGDSEAAYWGRAKEDDVQDRFERDHPEFTMERNPGRFVRKDRRWQLASPDGILHGAEDVLFEAKSADGMLAHQWGRSGTFDVPPGYRAQVLWYLDVLGLRQAWLAVLIGSSTYREYFLDLDNDSEAGEDLALLLERGEHFIWCLKNDVWPEPGDGSEATYQAVRQIHPEIDDTDAEIDPELAGEYLAAEIDQAAAEKRFTAARSLVLDAMGTSKNAIQAGDENRQRFAYRTARTTKDGEPGIPFLMTDKRMKKIMTIREAAEQ